MPKNKRSSGAKKQKNSPKQFLVETLQSAIFAFAFILVVHTFLFQPFVVPTPSMAGTVMPGDHIIVSKLHYGPQTPRTLGIPFTDLYVDNLDLPALRIPGFSDIERGDVVVFHYPPEIHKPIDKRQPYLKRVYGLPGDTFLMKDKIIYVNEVPQPTTRSMQQRWRIIKTDARVNLPGPKLAELDVEEVIQLPNSPEAHIMASHAAIAEIASWPYIERVEPIVTPYNRAYDRELFPPDRGQTIDNFGPIWIPKAGESRQLNDKNWEMYAHLIRHFEGRSAERGDDGAFLIDDVPSSAYSFTQDYYFMIGDNRDNSLDSRFWGFVPADHIMGKAMATFFSWDEEHSRIRFDRVLKRIR